MRARFTVFAAMCVMVISVALLSPAIAPKGAFDATMRDSLKAPCAEYPLGADKMGRDLLSRIIYGTRASLSMSFAVVISVSIIGTFLGLISGYFGGFIDGVIMRFSDMMIAFPGMVLAIAIAGMLGSSATNAVIAVTAVTWPKYTRLSRSLVLKAKTSLYIQGARLSGATSGRVVFGYILPVIFPTMLITAVTDIGSMMLELAALSFLGLGARAPSPEWGLMMNEARPYLARAPWLMVYPGVAVIMVVAVFNLFGDSLRDIMDPRHSG
nr:nickel transporter permease [uncultured Dethiosulfovibrio sp.]